VLFSNPPLLALLVNESRSKDITISKDIYSRSWIEPQYQNSITKLWTEYSHLVYPQDFIVLSIRTRIVQEILDEHTRKNTSVIILPCGFVSYAFMSHEEARYIELDLKDLIQYKSKIYEKLKQKKVFPKRNIEYIPIDLSIKKDRKIILSKLVSNEKQIFILEGISYYLTKKDWWNLLLEIKSLCKKDDLIIFDYWSYEEKLLDVYERFRIFCNNNMITQINSFLFLKKQDIVDIFPREDVKFESVLSAEYRFTKQQLLQKNNILNDTFAIISIN